jgi:predicted ATP-grasp superfamily ATP-dependent carboligase
MVDISTRNVHSASAEPSIASDVSQTYAEHPEFQQGICDALVLNAQQRQSLVTVRSLGKHGLYVAALETPDNTINPTFASRWCHHKLICPPYTTTQELLPYFDQLLATKRARVVIPTADSDVAMLRYYREKMKPRAGLALAKESALAIAISKEQTLEIAQHLHLRIPRGVTLKHVDEVAEAIREVGLPAVIKPDESWIENERQSVRVASSLVTTPDEARRAVEELTSLGGTVLFQQFLSGKREAVSFLYANSQMHARFAQWAKRTHPPLGGTSILRQSITIPIDIGEQAESLIREIDLEGYSEVEFRRDSAGYPYLMEINPRLSASVEVAVRAGVDFPYLLYQWASGEHIDMIEGYRTGLWMRYLGGDIATTIAALQQRGRPGVPTPTQTLFGFCSSFFMPMHYDYFDWKDPLPAWKTFMHAQRTIRARMRKRITTLWKNDEGCQANRAKADIYDSGI